MCDNLITLLRQKLNKSLENQQQEEEEETTEQQYNFTCTLCFGEFLCKKEIKFPICCLDCTISYMEEIIVSEKQLIQKSIDENPFKTLEELKTEIKDTLQKNNKTTIDIVKKILIGWLDNNIKPSDIILNDEQHKELSSTIDNIKEECKDNAYDDSFCSILYEIENVVECVNKLINTFRDKFKVQIHQRVLFQMFSEQLTKLENYIKLNGTKNITKILSTNDFDAISPYLTDIKIDDSILEKLEKTLLISYDALEGTRVGLKEPSQMRRNFETSVLRCPRCQRGPVFFDGCADLWAHHASSDNKFGDPSLHTDGRCRSCQFYGYLKSDWIIFGSNKDNMGILPVEDGGLWEPLKCKNSTNCYNINDYNWKVKKGTAPPRYPCEPWSGGSETNPNIGCDLVDNLQNRIQTKHDLVKFLVHKANSKKRFDPSSLGAKSFVGSFLSTKKQELFNEALSLSQALVNEVSRDDIINSFAYIQNKYGLPDWPNKSNLAFSEVLDYISSPFNGDISIQILSYTNDSEVEVNLYEKDINTLQIGKQIGSVNLNPANMMHTFKNFEGSGAFLEFNPDIKKINIYGNSFYYGGKQSVNYKKDLLNNAYEISCDKRYANYSVEIILN